MPGDAHPWRWWRGCYRPDGRLLGDRKGRFDTAFEPIHSFSVGAIAGTLHYMSFPTRVYPDGMPARMIELPIWPTRPSGRAQRA